MGNNNRGQSTDVSSIPKSKSINPASSQSSENTYVQVKLTKEVLHAFEETTRINPISLIEEYLLRCDQEEGDVEGLMSSGSDEDDSSSDEDSDDDNSEEEDEDNGHNGHLNDEDSEEE